MTSLAIFLAAILSIGNRLPTDATARQALAEQYAADVAAAVGDDVELGLLEIATVGGESGFDPQLAQCRCAPWECDRDKAGRVHAFGMPQLHRHLLQGHAVAEVCGDSRLAMKLAADELARLRRRYGAIGALRWYVGCDAADKRVVSRRRFFRQFKKEVEGAS